jgi:hypothetical protein
MSHDAVFYLPACKADALFLVKRIQRPGRRFGLSFKKNISIPKPDGTKSGESGNMLFASHYGLESVGFDALVKNLMLEEVKPGLVVGNFKEEFLAGLSEAAGKEKQREEKQEEARLQRRTADDEKLRAAKRRYYLTAARVAGIKGAEEMDDQGLMDAALWVALKGDVPPLAEWLVATRAVPEQAEAPQIDDPEVVAEMMMSSVVMRRES